MSGLLAGEEPLFFNWAKSLSSTGLEDRFLAFTHHQVIAHAQCRTHIHHTFIMLCHLCSDTFVVFVCTMYVQQQGTQLTLMIFNRAASIARAWVIALWPSPTSSWHRMSDYNQPLI